MSARKPLGVATCADQIAAILDATPSRITGAALHAETAERLRIQSEILKLAKLVPAAERSKIAPVLAAMGRELGGFAVEEDPPVVEPEPVVEAAPVEVSAVSANVEAVVALFDALTSSKREAEAGGVPAALMEPLSESRLALGRSR